MELGPLWDHLVTGSNGIIMLACGVVMEAFKKIFSRFASSPWGKRLAYLAPVGWAWAALFIPWGLAPENASVGAKFMLGIVLGAATGWTYGTAKGLIKSREEASEVLQK